MKVKRFCRECETSGIPIECLADVAKLTRKLTRGVVGGSDALVEPLSQLLRLHGLPFSRTRSFQGVELFDMQLKAFQSVSAALESPVPAVHVAVAQGVSGFANQGHAGKYSRNGQEADLPFRIIAAPRCQVIPRLVNVIRDAIAPRVGVVGAAVETTGAGDSREEKINPPPPRFCPNALAFSPQYAPAAVAVLEALRDLSFHQACAERIVKEGLLTPLPLFLCAPPDSAATRLALEVLWNVLETCSTLASSAFRKNLDGYACIATLFRRVASSLRAPDREMRNDVTAVLCLLARDEASRQPLSIQGCLRIALEKSTELELGVKPMQSRVYPESEHEFKMLSWSLLLSASRDGVCLSLCLESKLLDVACLYLDILDPSVGDGKNDGKSDASWSKSDAKGKDDGSETSARLRAPEAMLHALSPSQRAETVDQAMRLLCSLAPRIPGKFVQLEVFARTFSFVRTLCTGLQDGTMAAEMGVSLVEQALELLTRCCDHVDTVNIRLDVQMADFLLGVFAEADWTPRVRVLSVKLLALLCVGHPYNQRILRKAGGVRLLAGALSALSRDTASDVRICAAALDCVWKAVIGNARSEAHWVRAGGVESMLDLALTGPYEMRGMLLSALGDLLLNAKALPAAWEWRGNISLIWVRRAAMGFEAYLPREGGVGAARVRSPKRGAQDERLSFSEGAAKHEAERDTAANESADNKAAPSGNGIVEFLTGMWEAHRPEGPTSDLVEFLSRGTAAGASRDAQDAVQTKVIFDTIRMNGDGDFEYRLRETDQEPSVVPREMVRNLKFEFDRIDVQRSRRLNASAVHMLCSNLGMNVESATIESLIKAIDVDGDGMLDFEEILAFFLLRTAGRGVEDAGAGRSNTPDPRDVKARKQLIEAAGSVTSFGERSYDEYIRTAINGVASLLNPGRSKLRVAERRRLNLMASYQTLLHGIDWWHLCNDAESDLKMEGLEPLRSDGVWIAEQMKGVHALMERVQRYGEGYDEERLEGAQTGVLDFLSKAVQKEAKEGKQMARITSTEPMTVLRRRKIKDEIETMVAKSLDERETLKQTLRCPEEKVDLVLAQIRANKSMLRQKTLSLLEKAAEDDDADLLS